MQYPLFWFARAVLAASCLGAGVPVWAQAQAIVGEATMVIGMASVLGSDGSQHPLERGAAIRVGDRIDTPEGGHVLLRFVDGGRLSVRPASRLHIESYSHSTSQPEQGAIKFRLDEGVVRSITGAWGEAARERFRLNTPVAAIGVKGTDFVVRSHADTTAATVYTGAITLASLSGDCSASVGPCLNGSEKLLTADMKGQMLELARSQSAPVLVASNNYAAKLQLRPEAAPPEVLARAPHALDIAAPDATSAKSLANETLGTTVAAYVPPPPPPAPEPAPPPPPAPEPVPPPPPAPEPAPPPPVVLPPQVTQLSWVRYGWVAQPDSDTFTIRLNEALVAGLQKVVGNINYVLYQQPRGTEALASTLPLADPIVSFRLADASAHLWRNAFRPTESVSVYGGALTVDFSRSIFSTFLSLSNPSIGVEQINASGAILPNGVMRADNSNANLFGAVTPDGREAGYAFEKAVNSGLLRGVTLWGR